MEDGLGSASRCRVRHIRSIYLQRSKLFFVASLLPLLIQLAVLFFLIGLCLFVFPRNTAVGWIVTSFIIVYGCALAYFTFIPLIEVYSPYKTPILQALFLILNYTFYSIVNSVYSLLGKKLRSAHIEILGKALSVSGPNIQGFRTFKAIFNTVRNIFFFDTVERGFRDERQVDLLSASAAFPDTKYEVDYRNCLKDLDWEALDKTSDFWVPHPRFSDPTKAFKHLMKESRESVRTMVYDVIKSLMPHVEDNCDKYWTYFGLSAPGGLWDSNLLKPHENAVLALCSLQNLDDLPEFNKASRKCLVFSTRLSLHI